MDTV
jgi:hypothetical protein